MKSRVISVTINRPFEEVYAFACVPENFMKWASGLASSLHKEDDVWLARTPLGEAVVVFSELNKFGVLDHSVHLPNGQVVEVPLRVIKNGEGADVMLTLFQMPRACPQLEDSPADYRVIYRQSADSELTDAPLCPSGRSMGQDQGGVARP